MNTSNQLEINVPIPMDGYWGGSAEFIAEKLIEQYEKYGLKRFSLAAPSNGQMNRGVATTEYYIEKANKFKKIKEILAPYPIECGWWIATTLHTGENPGAAKYVDINGEESNQTICIMAK